MCAARTRRAGAAGAELRMRPCVDHDRDPMEEHVNSYATSPEMKVLACAFCTVGIFGNVLALFILHRARSSSNKRHVFMLRCLVTNDCVALAGKLGRTFVRYMWPSTEDNVWMCRSRVLFRFFVWGSVCAATVMAIDRWLAFTKPFFYHSHITFRLLKRMMVILWLEVLCLVCLPLFGVGLYRDENLSQCERLRNAKKPLDVFYAYFYFGHGVIFYSTIVYMNLAVMRTLCKKNSFRNHRNGLIRHISRGSSLTCNEFTKEERSFAWLMVMLCVGAVICFVPELLAMMLNRYIMDESMIRPFNIAADVLLVIHFTLDPCLNVLYHWLLVKSVCSRSKDKKNTNGGSATVSCYSRTANKVSLQLLL